MTKQERIALVDGDTVIFAATSGTEYEMDWGDDWWSLSADLKPAIGHFQLEIENIREALECERVVIALSDTERYRPSIMPEYKSNRKDRKPITYVPLREWVRENYITYQRPLLEGDDVLGILATTRALWPGDKIIVSIDKDLLTIPGKHFNYNKPEKGIVEVTEEEADYNHMYQTLCGDRTDGYPGCPGVGPVKAAKLLEGAVGYDEMWPIVVAAFRKAGLGEAVALQNAQVARILRQQDFDFSKKEHILWTP